LSSPSSASSLFALGLGVVISVGVSALFGALGWGGEFASQTAGAASGTAPLILDGIRRRRTVQRERPGLVALGKSWLYRPKLWIASLFGFAVLLVDSAAGLVAYRMTGWLIRLARADQDRFMAVYTLIGVTFTLPVVLLGTYLLAIAAGHRVGQPSRRWILFGMAVYSVVRLANVLTAGPAAQLDLPRAAVVASILVTVPLLLGAALVGARRARRTQAIYYAKTYFGRLGPDDQQAALALLEETTARRRSSELR